MKFKRFLVLMLVGILIMSSLAGCGKNGKEVDQKDPENAEKPEEAGGKGEEVELLISAAASLTDVLNELKDMYKDIDPDLELNYSFGSSGALQAQIEEGAPVDIFMSAAQKQMKDLQEGGHMIDESIRTLLVNKVVLITPKDSDLELESFEDLTGDQISKIAIGDPGNVPVGQYSEEIFNNLNIMDKIDSKFVLGNDVRTVLTWVENGEVDCGIVYATDAYTSDDIEIITEAPEGSHEEVSYPVGIVKDSKHGDKAQEFLDYLFTDEVGELFEKYGFSMK